MKRKGKKMKKKLQSFIPQRDKKILPHQKLKQDLELFSKQATTA